MSDTDAGWSLPELERAGRVKLNATGQPLPPKLLPEINGAPVDDLSHEQVLSPAAQKRLGIGLEKSEG